MCILAHLQTTVLSFELTQLIKAFRLSGWERSLAPTEKEYVTFNPGSGLVHPWDSLTL